MFSSQTTNLTVLQYQAHLESFKIVLDDVLDDAQKNENELFSKTHIKGDPVQTLARGLWNMMLRFEKERVNPARRSATARLLHVGMLAKDIYKEINAIFTENCCSSKVAAPNEDLLKIFIACQQLLRFFMDDGLDVAASARNQVIAPVLDKLPHQAILFIVTKLPFGDQLPKEFTLAAYFAVDSAMEVNFNADLLAISSQLDKLIAYHTPMSPLMFKRK